MIKLYANFIEVPVKIFKFSGGEVSVKIENPSSVIAKMINIDADINSSDDLMTLLMLTDAIRRIDTSARITLGMPYLPYARQDRVMVPGESLSIKVFTSIINAQNYAEVMVWDAHSDVGVALIDRCVNVPQYALVRTGNVDEKTILVSPDAGAEKKIFSFAKEFGFAGVIRAGKVRDVSTGKIMSTEVNWPTAGYKTDRDFMIVDDICDGGGTFIALAEVLRPRTTGKIKLLITHGIFSKGIEVFDGIIDEVMVINNINKAKSTDQTKVTELY